MGKINKLHNKNNEAIYPVSISHAVYMDDGTTTLHEEIVKLNLNNIKYNPEIITIKKEELSFSIFDNNSSNLPVINSTNISLSHLLRNISC